MKFKNSIIKNGIIYKLSKSYLRNKLQQIYNNKKKISWIPIEGLVNFYTLNIIF